MKNLRGVRRILEVRVTSAVIRALVLSGVPPGWRSSHSDAPLIKQDPQANLTDVYAFVGTKYDDPNERVLNVLVSVRPFSDPCDGVMYERFADDALYSIHITDPATGETLRPHLEHAVPENSPLAEELLSDLGIPAYDIVRVISASGEQVYLLNGERETESSK